MVFIPDVVFTTHALSVDVFQYVVMVLFQSAGVVSFQPDVLLVVTVVVTGMGTHSASISLLYVHVPLGRHVLVTVVPLR